MCVRVLSLIDVNNPSLILNYTVNNYSSIGITFNTSIITHILGGEYDRKIKP